MGKSYLAAQLECEHQAVVCSSDRYWQQPTVKEQWSLEGHRNEAMPWCQARCRMALSAQQPLVVLDNWNLQVSKFEGLFRLAESLQYQILLVAICAQDYETARAALERNVRAGWDEARKANESRLYSGFQTFQPAGVACIEQNTPVVGPAVLKWVVRHLRPVAANEQEPLLWSSAPGAAAIKPRPDELVILALLAKCVPFARGKVEIAGSFALNIFQRQHEQELQYALPQW